MVGAKLSISDPDIKVQRVPTAELQNLSTNFDMKLKSEGCRYRFDKKCNFPALRSGVRHVGMGMNRLSSIGDSVAWWSVYDQVNYFDLMRVLMRVH